jgi:hypothetical protein
MIHPTESWFIKVVKVVKMVIFVIWPTVTILVFGGGMVGVVFCLFLWIA